MAMVNTAAEDTDTIVTNPWFLYVLQCSDNTLYTGITNDFSKRLARHNTGKGAKYTRARLPVSMEVCVAVGDRSQASKLEYRFKQLSRSQKLAQIDCKLDEFLRQQSDTVNQKN